MNSTIRRPLLFLLAVALLGFAGYRQFVQAAVHPADQARCEQAVRAQGGDDAEALALLMPKCTEPGMVAMMDASAAGDSAQVAASRIAAANQADTSAHLLDWAMIGAGLVALAGAALPSRRS